MRAHAKENKKRLSIETRVSAYNLMNKLKENGKSGTEILKEIKKPVEISIVEDPTLNMSDCLMEADYGVLDARIESQFKEIKSFFIE